MPLHLNHEAAAGRATPGLLPTVFPYRWASFLQTDKRSTSIYPASVCSGSDIKVEREFAVMIPAG